MEETRWGPAFLFFGKGTLHESRISCCSARRAAALYRRVQIAEGGRQGSHPPGSGDLSDVTEGAEHSQHGYRRHAVFRKRQPGPGSGGDSRQEWRCVRRQYATGIQSGKARGSVGGGEEPAGGRHVAASRDRRNSSWGYNASGPSRRQRQRRGPAVAFRSQRNHKVGSATRAKTANTAARACQSTIEAMIGDRLGYCFRCLGSRAERLAPFLRASTCVL